MLGFLLPWKHTKCLCYEENVWGLFSPHIHKKDDSVLKINICSSTVLLYFKIRQCNSSSIFILNRSVYVPCRCIGLIILSSRWDSWTHTTQTLPKFVKIITLNQRQFREYVCILLLPDKVVKFLFLIPYISFLTNS